MALQAKVKAVLILGNKIDTELKQYYQKPSYLLIGDGGKGVSKDNIFDHLKGRIDSTTKIDILTHGILHEGKYKIKLKSDGSLSEISELLGWLKAQNPDSPLQVHLRSCFANGAAKYAKSLSEGSLLFTYVAEQSLSTKELVAFSIQNSIMNLAELNPFQNFLNNLVINSLQAASVTMHLNGQLTTWKIQPTIKEVIYDPISVLNNAVDRFIKFYDSIHEQAYKRFKQKGQQKFAYLKPEHLLSIKFGEQEKEDLKVGYFIHTCVSNDTTPLQKLAETEDGENKLKAIVNQTIKGLNSSALHAACYKGFSEMVEFLLRYGINANNLDLSGNTPLHLAVFEEHEDIVKQLLEYGADPDVPNIDGATAIFTSTRLGNKPITNLLIDKLLENNANPNRQSHNGCTPLHLVSEDTADIAEALLTRYGVDPNIYNKNGETALFLAAINGHLFTLTVLLKNSANNVADPNKPRKSDDITPIMTASQNGHIDAVNVLIKHKANPALASFAGDTPLCFATQQKHLDVVIALLDILTVREVNRKCGNIQTSLSWAVQSESFKIAKSLLMKKADPNIPGKDDMTPLFIAAHKNNLKLVKLLVKHHADPTIKYKGTTTPFQTTKSDAIKKVLQNAEETWAKTQADKLTTHVDNLAAVKHEKSTTRYEKHNQDYQSELVQPSFHEDL